MLTKIQSDILEDIDFASMDVEGSMREVSSSPTIENLKENLWTLINDAKKLIQKAEELHGMICPNSSVTP